MQTYVAEIDGRAIFAFRSVDVVCAQAWLDIHTIMRARLERLKSGGSRIWNGHTRIIARQANNAEETVWSELRNEVSEEDLTEEPDYLTVWLIPTSDDSRSIIVNQN